VKYSTYTESARTYTYYGCSECGGFFPYSPLKAHYPLEHRGNR